MMYRRLPANTVEQFVILLWLDENFAEDALKVELTSRNTAHITDPTGARALVTCGEQGKITLSDLPQGIAAVPQTI